MNKNVRTFVAIAFAVLALVLVRVVGRTVLKTVAVSVGDDQYGSKTR